jgi:hypothetical protein
MKNFGLMLIFAAMAGSVLATPVAVPEIDPGSAATAVAMLAGSLLVFRSRKKQ